MYKHIITAVVAIFLSIGVAQPLSAQSNPELVQISGLVLSSDSLVGIPYASVVIKGSGRGTITDYQGFFSLVAAKGDVIVFSSLGYQKDEYLIPDSIKEKRFSTVLLLSQSTTYIDTVVVFPWPSKEDFREAFLALNLPPDEIEIAKRNLEKKRLAELGATLPLDGNENADLYLRNEAYKFYYAGQAPPMNIFSPLAWAKFIQAWKNGDFKKKD